MNGESFSNHAIVISRRGVRRGAETIVADLLSPVV
jgi:hypothetical protein